MTNAPRLNERILSFFVQHYVRNGEPIFERVVNTTLVRIIFLHRRYIKCLPFLQNSKKSQVELVIRGSELLCALFNEWRTANENGKLLIMMINRLYEHVRDLRYKIFVSHAVRPRMKLVYQVGRALKNTNRDCEILNYTNRTCDKVLLDLLSPNMTTVSATGLNVPPFIHYEDDKTFEKVQVFSYVPTTFALRNPYLGPFFAIPAKNMELPQAGLNVLYEYLPLPEMPLLETLTVGFKCIETSPPPSTKLYTQIMEGLKLAAPNLKDLALRYRLLIDSRKISKHLQQLELVMSKVKYLAEGIQLSKINSSGIVMDFEFSTVIENHTFDHCKSEFQRILQTDRFDWLNNDDDFEEGLERRTFEATVFMYEVPVKVTILVAQSQWLDPNMDLLEKICEPI